MDRPFCQRQVIWCFSKLDYTSLIIGAMHDMEIKIVSLIEGAQNAEGTVIIIDVYRAFTTASVAFARGVERILLTAEIDEALTLRAEGAGELCMGEVDGIRPKSFDFGNSPFELSLADVSGKTIIQSTRAGTVGVSAASKATRIYGCSLVNAKATAKVVLAELPKLVTIVAMGDKGLARTDEDEICALYLRNLLLGRSVDAGALRTLVLAGQDSDNFDNLEKPQYHPRDRDLALAIDSHSFAIAIHRKGGLLIAHPVNC